MYFGSIPLNSGPIPAGMGQFLWNPVESRLFQCHSSVFWWNPVESRRIQRNGCIPAGICGASKSTGESIQGNQEGTMSTIKMKGDKGARNSKVTR